MMDINQTVAINVRKARDDRGLTLDAAAVLTGVSRSMLAQIEKGDVNPTITVLWKIAGGYKVSFTSLVETQEEGTLFVAADEVKPLIEDEGRYINYPLFAYDEETKLEMYRIEIKPLGGLNSRPHLAGTREYATVFEGQVEIRVGEKVYSLKKGDSVRFAADEKHGYKNVGKKKAELSMVISYQ